MTRISLSYFAAEPDISPEKTIMKYTFLVGSVLLPLLAAVSCEKLDDLPTGPDEAPADSLLTLEGVAKLLSSLPVEAAQLAEVHDAVTSSGSNGYDEEYTMRQLFAAPGSGVGAAKGETKGSYARPLRELIREAVFATRAVETSTVKGDPEAWLQALSTSDFQIYWPFSERWDGRSRPVITFDPLDNSARNEGYECLGDGSFKTLIVDEQMAMERPVWVVNRNSDAGYKTLELLRREDPSWGESGGDLVVRTKAAEGDFKTLILRSFQANRNYDSWFTGASEFFVKCGAVEDFFATTEAELQLYSPSITDFLIVVRRGQTGQTIPFNAVLVSEWTSGLQNCALMLTEDDGGTRTTWKCSAMVKYNSKSYGFELEIPLHSRDDIVWRGSLTRNYIERYSGTTGHFGDVELVLELI